MTLDRQCVYEFINQLAGVINEYEAVLSLAAARGFRRSPKFSANPYRPALNTTFIGQTKKPGLWLENCRGCGDCKLDSFADVCPVTRCSKGLFNGPCGGSKDEKCEVDRDTPCAWQ